ncbi:hypothetical protein K488DRAFT_77198 [Vararia minispora EC-137]|uniref:Uncharacterized protein n=1 Tax=Vararia minispora EC-137 TaxID=1314806 RepID=A0ACB8QSN4_9AGAM|nr:hypothetical protein K488DRAFT_77198 [Vararia minispora EC-137]
MRLVPGGKVHHHHSEALCPQADALYPTRSAELWGNLSTEYGTDEFKGKAIEWLSGAVQVPTESFDTMGAVGEDERWEVFGPFHEYLLQAFPLVHSTLLLTKVNTWGLIYEWKGSDESLKPLLLAAHQDVVPVERKTVEQWEHPPFSGYFDGENIWGRGSSDDKSGLIGIMTTIETLISKGFAPTRTVVLAFGFDEEASGLQGAASLAPILEEMHGAKGYAMLVDEGGAFAEQFGSIFATPGIAEKGYTDTRVTVNSPGGHSSLPPEHTTIGILSQLLVHLEATPPSSELHRATPFYGTVQCYAAHGKGLPKGLRHAIKKSVRSDRYLKEAERILFKDPSFKSLAGTTQAIDLIQGGVKSNALPEEAWAVVNHRIATDSSVEHVQDFDTKRLAKLAHKFNLTISAFGKDVTPVGAPSFGKLTLEDAWGTSLEPAPITPTDADAVPFRVLSGTIRATYDSHYNTHADGAFKKEIIVSPGIMSGNTDTRYYWGLTDHIFRYNHHNAGSGRALAGVHTVNEHIAADDLVGIIRYFTTLILNVDEATDM